MSFILFPLFKNNDPCDSRNTGVRIGYRTILGGNGGQQAYIEEFSVGDNWFTRMDGTQMMEAFQTFGTTQAESIKTTG